MGCFVCTGDDSIEEIEKFISTGNFSSVFILVDSNTRQFCLPLILDQTPSLKKAFVIEIPSGESEKSLSNFEHITTVLLKKNADRQSLLINIGGGVICDIGGFVASVYKRGIRFINIPTTLLSMSDAAIGGKTGINYLDKKNVIGTFCYPVAIFIYPPFLKTLSPKEVRSGFAEIFKHVLLSDAEKLNSVINGFTDVNDEQNLKKLIDHSVRFKLSITEADFKEEGKRAMLNFGHTLGHALESLSLKGVRPLRHGEAIAAGMAGELFLSHKIAGFPAEVMHESIHFLRNFFNDIQLKCNPEDLFNYLSADKKNKQDNIGFSLLSSPGKYSGIYFPSHEEILESINFMILEFSSTAVQ